MTITKNLNGTALEIALAGRLDTMTAPELEAELNKDLGGADSLMLDFGKLDYISSEGRHEDLQRQRGCSGSF